MAAKERATVPAFASSPSPSTSPSAFASPSPTLTHQRRDSDLTPWYFPGPSSRFNKQHERTRSSIPTLQRGYTSVAPVLCTAARAQHRRAQSSANVPTLRSTLLSPTPARHSTRLHRHSSSQSVTTLHNLSNTMARPNSAYGPVTPGHPSRPTSKLQDSPFSDYFTDDGRSPSSNSSAPSPETQQLLVRLNRIQSQIMRGERENERETVAIVAGKMQEMEGLLDSVHAQTRLPVEMEDSGLFMEEDEDEDEQDKDMPVGKSEVKANLGDVFNDAVTAENRQAEHDFLILEAQRTLENMRKLEQSLRQRHAELKELSGRYDVHVEEVDRRFEALKEETEALASDNANLEAENASLKQDIGHDHTELLWLKIQFKTLELEYGASEEGARRLEGYAPELRDEIQDVKRERVAEHMKRWEVDWMDVSRNMEGRRRTYDVFALEGDGEPGAEHGQDSEDADMPGWELPTVKDDFGKVQSLTITRVPKHVDQLGGNESQHEHTPMPEEDVEGENQEQYLSLAINLPVIETQPSPTEAQHLSFTTDLPTIETTPINPKKPIYISSSTQTDPSPSSATSRTSSWLFAEEFQSPHALDSAAAAGCAITTSSEDTDGVDEFGEMVASEQWGEKGYRTPAKTAWQELWTGLGQLAGLGEEEGD